jgi:hypothetical protein
MSLRTNQDRDHKNKLWLPSDPESVDVRNDSPFGSLQSTVLELLNALLDLDSNKSPGPDGVPLLILKNCASAFALSLSLLFNRSLASCVFPDRWNLSFNPISKSGKRNVVSKGRLSQIYSNTLLLF